MENKEKEELEYLKSVLSHIVYDYCTPQEKIIYKKMKKRVKFLEKTLDKQ